MLQVNVIRQNVQEVKERLAVKNFKMPELVDSVIALDDQRKKLQLEFDTTQASVNSASKEIGGLMAKGEKEAAETKKKEVAELKNKLQPIQQQSAVTEEERQQALVQLPNLPSVLVPAGTSPEDNEVVREGGT